MGQKNTLPIEAARLIPHRPPMLLVRELVKREGDRAEGTAVVPAEGICIETGGGFPEFYIEIIAQTVAMANGYDVLCAGGTLHDGMLVGIDSFSFYKNGRPGALLAVEAEKTFEFGAVNIIDGRVFQDGELLAEGRIKVWEDLEQEE